MFSAADILSDDGPFAGFITGYRVRPQQQAMAEAISMAITGHESLICEAGTGTGKTFAYLIPAILSGNKVIISTGTKHLQDQLFKRDLPLVKKALNIPVNVTLLKGRGNYLCLHRLKHAETDHGYLNNTTRSQLFTVKQWSVRTTSGDLAELTGLPETSGVRPLVTSTRENCLGAECDFYDDCFVFKARRLANEADLIVVNHHLFLADLALRDSGYGELLPVVDTVIFDEAHKLPELASEFFSRTLSSHQILELIRDSKAAYFAEAADLPEYLELLDKLDTAIRELRLAFGRDSLRVAWHEQKDRKQVKTALQTLLNRAHDIHQVLESFAERGKQLENCFKRFGTILDGIAGYVDYEEVDAVQWLETRGNGFLFHQTPLDIAETFQTHLREYESNNIYTSATLSVNNDFQLFAGQLGLEQVNASSWESPFDYQKQILFYRPVGLPDPREQGYTELVIEKAVPVLELTRGHAFLLFTSHRALQIAAEIINDVIDFPVLIQGDAPRTELLDAFRRTEHAVLLGTSSFWEGVDVKGQALSCVIIDKLPFAAPDDPILRARMQRMEEQGRNPFMEYQLPEAVITLKQGIGRLIRDNRDYGVLMICDPRLTTKPYGKVFLKSLPEMQQTNSLEDVERFFTEFELDMQEADGG